MNKQKNYVGWLGKKNTVILFFFRPDKIDPVIWNYSLILELENGKVHAELWPSLTGVIQIL